MRASRSSSGATVTSSGTLIVVPSLNRAWHERARLDHPGWPAVPYEGYFALAGATTELIRAEVRQGRTETIASLEDTLVCLHLAVLAARPWSAPAP